MEEGWRAVVALLLFQTSSSSSGRLHVPDRTTRFQLNDHQSRHFRAQRHRGTSQGCSTASLISTPGIKPHEGITHRHFNPLPWGGLNLASLSSLGHDNPSHPPKAEVARSALEMCARRAFPLPHSISLGKPGSVTGGEKCVAPAMLTSKKYSVTLCRPNGQPPLFSSSNSKQQAVAFRKEEFITGM